MIDETQKQLAQHDQPKALRPKTPRQGSSTFTTWFYAQFGDRRTDFTEYNDDELGDMVAAGWRAEEELELRKKYDAKHRAALYAWQAKDAAQDVAEAPSGEPSLLEAITYRIMR